MGESLAILGIVIMIVAVVYYVVFRNRLKKSFEKYGDVTLSEYKDDDIISEWIAKRFLSDSMDFILKAVIIHIVISAIIFFVGIMLIVFSSRI